MICPFLSIGKDKPVKCLEEKCGLYVADGDAELLGCSYNQSVIMMDRLIGNLYELFDGFTVDIEKELHSIAQGTSFIPDICC